MKLQIHENSPVFPRIFIILLLLLPAAVYSQQDNEISMEISPNPVGRGDRFGITILVDVEDPEMIEVNQPQLPGEIVLLRGPYIRPVWIETAGGEERRQTEITYLYRCDDTGRFEIGSFRIITPRRIFSTEPALLEVGVYRNRQLVVPLEVEWEVQPTSAYVGQNIICILKAYEQKDIRIFDDTAIEAPSQGFFQPAEGVGAIRKYSRGGVALYEIPVESFVFTPSSPGTATLPGARVNWENGRAVSSRINIQIEPLPEAVRHSGAVGNFRLEAEIGETELSVGQRMDLTVRITGVGNLNYLQFPEIDAPSFTVIGEDETSEYTATIRGYQGWRQYTYTLLAEEAGPARVVVKSLTAFDPLNDRVYFSPGDAYQLNIEPQMDAGDTPPEVLDFPYMLVDHREMERVNMSLRFRSWYEYLWLLPGPLVFLFFFLTKRRKAVLAVSLLVLLSFAPMEFLSEELVDSLETAESAYETGDYLTAEELYESALRQEPYIADLYYNAALSAYHQGKIGKAVLHTRTALVQKPMNVVYREFLGYINDRYGIVTQLSPAFPFHPDFFLLLLIFTLNTSGFLGVFYLFRERNGYFISAILLLVASIVIGIGMSYSVFTADSRTAVVMISESEVFEVKRIPKASSEADFILGAGETLQVLGGTEEYYFIRTSLGQKGWIEKSVVKTVPNIIELSRDISTDVTNSSE